jgi:hypothetical protein
LFIPFMVTGHIVREHGQHRSVKSFNLAVSSGMISTCKPLLYSED